jgi:hypothetical protein
VEAAATMDTAEDLWQLQRQQQRQLLWQEYQRQWQHQRLLLLEYQQQLQRQPLQQEHIIIAVGRLPLRSNRCCAAIAAVQ